MRFLLQLGLFASCAPALCAAPVFQDGFEAATLSMEWTTDGTNTGRVAVDTQYEPATGQRHLVLDDSVSDAASSVAEAILRLDLANKRSVVLAFKAKSLGNEPDEPPVGNLSGTRTFDGVSISLDQGATWHLVRSLAAVGSTWESLSIELDGAVGALGGTYGHDFRIRFSEYDNGPAPVDGIAIDDLLVTAEENQRALVEVPTVLTEGSSANVGYVLLAFAPATPLTLDLIASVAGQTSLPATVTVPAGETVASFTFSVTDDLLVNLTRTVSIRATAAGVVSTPGVITILDNEALVATLTLPAQSAEGATPSNNASVSVDRAPSVPLTINLSATPTGELTLPASLTLPSGQQQVAFTIRAVDDTKLDGSAIVTITATGPAFAPVTAQTETVDNEARILTLLLPATLQEGDSGAGSLRIQGTLPADLVVTLTPANQAALSSPPTVTLAAGRTQTSFSVSALDNPLRDGTRTTRLDATAPTFPTAGKEIIIRDNDPSKYQFNTLSDIVNVSNPVTLAITPIDLDGNAISGFVGPVNLSVVLPDGSTQALTPATATLTNGSWAGLVTVPAVLTPPLRLRATDTAGISAESNPFDIMRVLNLRAADLVWDGPRSRMYASVPATAGGTHANRVVAIDPSNLQVTGDANTGQDPGQLELTSGGEFLYAALSGNGTIAKIEMASLTVSSTFEVGINPPSEVLYAGDMATVTGQPNLLVVSQHRPDVNPHAHGVAVYDNGVMRPVKTLWNQSAAIEPSADPSIFFGFDRESTQPVFRRLRLDGSGITEIDSLLDLFTEPGVDFRSAGNLAFSESGVEVDGSTMARVGKFRFPFESDGRGLVLPVLEENRVFFLRRQSGSDATYDSIQAFDPTSFALLRKVMLSPAVTSAGGFTRWGMNGLAFKTGNFIAFINSAQLIPSEPSANLITTLQAAPDPASVSSPLVYTVEVTNQGPNTSLGVLVGATLSESQTIQSVAASKGTASTAGTTVTWPIGELSAGASVILTITTLPQSAGSLTCAASATALSIDPDSTNNSASRRVNVGFQLAPDTATVLRLGANNLINDPTRDLLWASVPGPLGTPLGRSVVSINPVSGLISDPIAIAGEPRPNCIALSGNGRYLYIGLTGSSEVERIDLDASPVSSVRLPLGGYQAEDIEVLDGDGTSFLLTSWTTNSAIVFDGDVARPDRSDTHSVNRIERTATAGVFVGHLSGGSSFSLTRLSVTPTGVSVSQEVNNPTPGFQRDISGAGNRVLSSSGRLVDSGTLALVADLGVMGRPCLDVPNNRAYLLDGNRLHAFDSLTGASLEALPLPVTSVVDWVKAVRWGLDGFGFLTREVGPYVYIARWSKAIREGADLNANSVPDAWEAANLGGLGGDLKDDPDDDGIPSGLEYVYGTLPARSSSDPRQLSLGENGLIRLIFPRRAGLPPGFYSFGSTTDLRAWSPALGVTETVLATQIIGGVQMETVEALVPSSDPRSGFVRLVWPHP